MICSNPFIKDGAAFGCGQCMPCRVNRRREWAHRLMLERFCHADACFLTLTYDDEHLCYDEWVRTGDGVYNVPSRQVPRRATLVPEDLTRWLKRFREYVRVNELSEGIRFYAVGEYGSQSERPHYHVAVYGFPECLRVRCGYYPLMDGSCKCDVCRVYADTWGMGRIVAGQLSVQSAQYIAGYVTKKMTRFDDRRLYGRFPEFSRQSLKPGIGADALWDVASALLEFGLDSRPDVPASLGHGKGTLPLGRYLRRRLRVLVGRPAEAPDFTLDEVRAELQCLREDAFNSSRSFKSAVVEAGEGRRNALEARSRIYKERKSL